MAADSRRAAHLVQAWRTQAVAVTLGERGALLSYGDLAPTLLPAPPVDCRDSCGAEDRFAATAARSFLHGAVISEAVQAAVDDASSFVASGGAAVLHFPQHFPRHGSAPHPGTTDDDSAGHPDPIALTERVHARHGTVVATGGCFDLLHAGHVASLRAARRLCDALVVCLNSDDSVRRLKGPSRPLVPAEDRARVLNALEFVDAVLVFDEDTPAEAIRRLRRGIWSKGGDYSADDLPEAEVLRAWGGQAVVLPYVPGRSTSGLVRSASAGKPDQRHEGELMTLRPEGAGSLGNVLVTGGASGLGAAVVQAVQEAGGRPIALDRVAPKADVEHEVVDLVDRRDAEDRVRAVSERVGGLDAVVTAAGVDSCGRLDDVPAEDWDRVVLVNLLGTVAVVRAALPDLRQRPRPPGPCRSDMSRPVRGPRARAARAWRAGLCRCGCTFVAACEPHVQFRGHIGSPALTLTRYTPAWLWSRPTYRSRPSSMESVMSPCLHGAPRPTGPANTVPGFRLSAAAGGTRLSDRDTGGLLNGAS